MYAIHLKFGTNEMVPLASDSIDGKQPNTYLICVGGLGGERMGENISMTTVCSHVLRSLSFQIASKLTTVCTRMADVLHIKPVSPDIFNANRSETAHLFPIQHIHTVLFQPLKTAAV